MKKMSHRKEEVIVCLFVWVSWYINIFRLFITKYIFKQINNSISYNSGYHKYTV